MHIALKVGKPQGINFFKPYTLRHFSTQQPTIAFNPTCPDESGHYPLQLYTTLRVVNIFSTPLKLVFYQNTYITTIFHEE